MSHKYVLDTHTLIWRLEGNQRLGANAKVVIDNPRSELVLPLIALLEATFLIERGRTRIASVAKLLGDVQADTRIMIHAVTMEVFQQSLNATVIPEIHDRLVVATVLHLQSLGHQVSLLTRDNLITRARVVDTVW